MTERRAEVRMLCADLVRVRWKDPSGRIRRVVAILEDISRAGVCLQLDTPVPIDTTLRITHPKAEFEGSVRYCLFRETGYFLGVRFAPGCRWSRQRYKPLHLLDLHHLVTRSARRACRQRPDASASPQ